MGFLHKVLYYGYKSFNLFVVKIRIFLTKRLFQTSEVIQLQPLSLWNDEPAEQVKNDLRRFQVWVETGKDSHLGGSFSWLPILQCYGDRSTRKHVHLYMHDWLMRQQNLSQWFDEFDLLTERLFYWICHYRFLSNPADIKYLERLNDSILTQVILCLYHPKSLFNTRIKLTTIRTLLCITLCISGFSQRQGLIEKQIKALIKRKQKQYDLEILESPNYLHQDLRIFLEMRACYQIAEQKIPDFINNTIDRLALSIKFLRLGDGGFTVFSGGHEEDSSKIDLTLRRAGVGAGPLTINQQGRLIRLQKGKLILVCDTGMSKAKTDGGYRSEGAFELSIGRSRMVVNCGNDLGVLSNELKTSPAHSALAICGKENSESKYIKHNLFLEEDEQAILIRRSLMLDKQEVIHQRRMKVMHNGDTLTGIDNLFVEGACPSFYIRFHLHPSVSVMPLNKEKELMIKLPDGTGWKFSSHELDFETENSLYFGKERKKQKNEQIVLTNKINRETKEIHWQFKRIN